MIDILKKIEELRNARGWSVYELSKKSEVKQSTISSWYIKNSNPSITALQKICDAFGITISQFFIEDKDNIVGLTTQQAQLVKYSAKLNEKQMQAFIRFLQSLDKER